MTEPLAFNQAPPSSGPMSVLQVLPALTSGGVERGTLEIAQALREDGHRTLVASAGGILVPQLESLGASHITLPLQSKNPLQMYRNSLQLAALIQRENIQLVHARSRAPAWSCASAARRTKRPFVTTFHGQYSHQNRLKRYYNAIMLSGIRTVAVSRYIARHIEATYPQHRSKLELIPRGIDTEYFNPANISKDRTKGLQQQWQHALPDTPLASRRVILFPGRLTRLKGHASFIEAIAKLRDPQVLALIVGEQKGREHYIKSLNQLIQHHALQQQIKFVGRCDDMPAAYALSELVANVSTKPEAFGRTTCEAQAMGKLVIASQHGGAQETLHPLQHGGFCRPNDVHSTAKAIAQQLALGATELSAIQQASREHICSHYSLVQMRTKTLALYQHIIQHHDYIGK